MASDYQRDLKEAKDELSQLLASKEQIEIEIARQKRKVAALAELCGEGDFSEMSVDLDLGGLSEACATVLRGSREISLTAAQIMSELRELGFDLEKYKAPLASITTTVNRMVESGEVIVLKGAAVGSKEYKWAGMYGILAQRRHVIPRRKRLIDSVRDHGKK